jgi:polysaccharide biosynthesis/export protein
MAAVFMSVRRRTMKYVCVAASVALLTLMAADTLSAQQKAAPAAKAAAGDAAVTTPPLDYTIGVGDVLNIVFWREPELSGEVVVRPDGKVTVPLVKDVSAVGLTPAQLQTELEAASKRFIQAPNVTVSVRTINSRTAYIQGYVARPSAYPLNGPTTVLQFLAVAGGVLEFAKADEILIIRRENGKATSFKFNYNDVRKGKKLEQNIELKPGDTIIVP